MAQYACSFVIPAFNEERRLPGTLEAIAKYSASRQQPCEVIIADDGSSDRTAEVARAFSASHCTIRVVQLPHRGKGFAIRRGAFLARGEVIFLCDADLHASIEEVALLHQTLLDGADIAIGSRWLQHPRMVCTQPLFRRVCSRLFHAMVQCVLALPFKDTQCGLKAIRSRAAGHVFPLLSLNGWGYDAELIHVALAHGLQVEEVGLRLEHDYRSSHFRPLTDGWRTLKELAVIRWNEIRGAYRPAILKTVIEPSKFSD